MNYVPCAQNDIKRIQNFIIRSTPFVFIRFSDGETEVLQNRELKLDREGIIFRGKKINHIHPEFDKKHYEPKKHSLIRDDLMASLVYYKTRYIKGIPSSHNMNTNDQGYYIKIINDINNNITFADLLVNSNYRFFLKKIIPLIMSQKNKFLIGNHRCSNKAEILFKGFCPIQDNFFANYTYVKSICKEFIDGLPKSSVVLASCSSLANILGHYVALNREDITFLDVGSSINHLIGLKSGTRVYHDYVFGPKSLRATRQLIKHLMFGKLKLRW